MFLAEEIYNEVNEIGNRNQDKQRKQMRKDEKYKELQGGFCHEKKIVELLKFLTCSDWKVLDMLEKFGKVESYKGLPLTWVVFN